MPRIGQKTIDTSYDVIDTRDVIARIAYLESEKNDHHANAEPSDPTWADDNPADYDELLTLVALANELEDNGEWEDGMTLIADRHFEDYARQTAEDLDLIDNDAKWPCNCIDWEQAARELKHDYSSVEFDGETYWYRS